METAKNLENQIKLYLYVITLIVALPQLSETIYIPALPQLAAGFGVLNSAAEFTLTIYLIGFAIGVFVWGIVSDRIGRKEGLFLGLVIFMISSYGCWYSKSITPFMVFRFFQAFGASTGSVLGQAVARELIPNEKRANAFATVSIAMAFAPAVGPLLGGMVSQYFHWNDVFILLIALALFISLNIKLFLPSSLKKKIVKNDVSTFQMVKGCLGKMLKDPKILSLGSFVGAVNGLLFGYFGEAPFYFVEGLNMTSGEFGKLNLAISLPLALGGFISRRLIKHKYTSDQCIKFGINWVFVSSLLFIVISYFQLERNYSNELLYISIGMICLIFTGITIIIPNCLSQALVDYSQYTGTAAAIFGLFYYTIVSISTFFMGVIHNGSLQRLPIFLGTLSLFMLLIYKFIYPKKFS